VLHKPFDLDQEVANLLLDEVERRGVRRLVIDSVAEPERGLGFEGRTGGFLAALVSYLRSRDVTMCLTLDVPPDLVVVARREEHLRALTVVRRPPRKRPIRWRRMNEATPDYMFVGANSKYDRAGFREVSLRRCEVLVGSGGMPTCPHCQQIILTRDGHDRHRRQRFTCGGCGRDFTIRSTSAFSGYRWPADVILMAVRWYLRHPLSATSVIELLAERGVDVSNRTVLRWVQAFGPQLAAEARQHRRPLGRNWYTDEMFFFRGQDKWYLYRAVDEHGQVVDVLLQEHRDTASAEAFFEHALGRSGQVPSAIITDHHQHTSRRSSAPCQPQCTFGAGCIARRGRRPSRSNEVTFRRGIACARRVG